MLTLKLQCFGHLWKESIHWKRPWCWKRLKAKEKWAADDEMVRWHQHLNGHEFEQTLGDSEGQKSLVCCSPWGCKVSDMSWRQNNNSILLISSSCRHSSWTLGFVHLSLDLLHRCSLVISWCFNPEKSVFLCCFSCSPILCCLNYWFAYQSAVSSEGVNFFWNFAYSSKFFFQPHSLLQYGRECIPNRK